MKDFKKYYGKLVELVWWDIRSHSSWINEPLLLDPITCVTYGILIGVNKSSNSLVIASTKAEEEDLPPWSDLNIIPVSLVKSIKLK